MRSCEHYFVRGRCIHCAQKDPAYQPLLWYEKLMMFIVFALIAFAVWISK
jgi:hypothetical protein